jgi:hypothetical protein
MEFPVMETEERRALRTAIEALWPRIEKNEASLEEVRDLALTVFDRLKPAGLDRWEKHHFVWVLKGLATSRQTPGAGLYTALHGVELALVPPETRDAAVDDSIDQVSQADLREWVAAA